MFSVDNFDEYVVKIFVLRLSFFNRRQFWISWDIFGFCDFEGEFDIVGMIVEGRNVVYFEYLEMLDLEIFFIVFCYYNFEGINCSLGNKYFRKYCIEFRLCYSVIFFKSF